MRIAVIGNVAVHHLEFVMFVLPADLAHLKALKRDVRSAIPQLTSSQADEALATSAGFRTYAALKAATDRPWVFQDDLFERRLSELKIENHIHWKSWGDFNAQKILGLGFHPDQVDVIRTVRHVGGILVSGTAGSGKSTTVRNILADMNAGANYRLKIFSVEDPPEYRIPITSSIPVVRHAPGDDPNVSPFLAPLLACMHGDPDILMIGEVRDPYTADGFKKATQSGHVVLSTIHASSALGIIERLRDFDITDTVLASPEFLEVLIYQKLLPVLCPGCSRPMDLGIRTSLLDRLEEVLKDTELAHVRVRGEGCSLCRHQGVVGRTVCADVLAPTYEMRYLIRSQNILGCHQIRYGARPPLSGPSCGPSALSHALWKMTRGMIDPKDIETLLGPVDGEKGNGAA